MHHDTPTTTTRLVSRRHALITGTVGAAAAAFLASCSSESQAGRSGTPTTTTEVAPKLPKKDPSAEAEEEDVTLLRTGTSLELLVAEVYDTYGPKLDAEWVGVAERFSADHASTADAFSKATKADKQVKKPNKFLMKNTVEPIEDTLTSDRAILDLFRDLESTLVATYIDAAGTFTEADWRARVMTFGSASARRVAVLDNGGEGAAPEDALYPLRDLIPNDAYESASPKKAGPG